MGLEPGGEEVVTITEGHISESLNRASVPIEEDNRGRLSFLRSGNLSGI